MRFVYSVLRFVPDPARGEFINVGAIVGSEEASEWKMRLVDNLRRARALDDANVLPALWHFVSEIDRRIDEYAAYIESRTGSTVELSESWLQRLSEEAQNVVQLSAPTPVVAASAEEAMDTIFGQLIVDPESRRFPFQKKNVAMAAIRRAYTTQGVQKHRHFAEAALVQGQHHRERFDFAVVNSQVVQLAQAWSFQIPNQVELVEAVKAWAWTVRDLRNGGGTAQVESAAPLAVPANVEVEVVYIPPRRGENRTVLEEALSAFSEVRARALEVDGAEQVGQRAKDLLAASGAEI